MMKITIGLTGLQLFVLGGWCYTFLLAFLLVGNGRLLGFW